MSGPTDDIDDRIRRLEDRVEIGELIARYGMVMDDRDVAAMPDLFTEDVVIRSLDGGMTASGRDDAVAMYRRRLTALGPSNHVTHDRVITLDPARPDQAQGIVLSHAEMSLKGAAMLAAIRYHDRYRRDGGRWRFSERVLSFMYFVPVAEYRDALGPGLANRNRVLETPRPADWPEQLASWKQYYGDPD